MVLISQLLDGRYGMFCSNPFYFLFSQILVSLSWMLCAYWFLIPAEEWSERWRGRRSTSRVQAAVKIVTECIDVLQFLGVVLRLAEKKVIYHWFFECGGVEFWSYVSYHWVLLFSTSFIFYTWMKNLRPPSF